MMPETSDSRGSGQSGSAGKKIVEKPPFKLCFPKHRMSGRSDIRASKIEADFITPKFYSKQVKFEDSYNVDGTVKAVMKKENEKPQDVHRRPLLSSQSYGWWYDRTFGMRDKRFNHHKNTSEMVRSYDAIQWQDKKIQGLCH
ncbi:uncharacterized protein [Venturia canescens]|uniref:uncharacterized protein n=1 Tax=Venturia canescens TaxID=32260 RepID=UPI001C9C4905|nr:uncharacterized protein LOC122419019 [Venturia canescens]XP_043289184.1 uncharacterized protein LOC122419019 [Venturia canescens]